MGNVILPPPSLDINGDDVWIQTYKEGLNPPTNICVDKIYRTDKKTLTSLFFQSDPNVYEKEIKKTAKEQKMDQEYINDVHDLLFHRTKTDIVGLIASYTKTLEDMQEKGYDQTRSISEWSGRRSEGSTSGSS